MHLAIKKFDPSVLTKGSGKMIFVVGKRGTGKSVLVRDLMYHLRHHCLYGVVLSCTEEGNSYYGQFVPDIFVYSDFNRLAIERLIERQKKMAREGKLKPAFLVLDDCLYERKIMYDPLVRLLAMNGRHFGLTVVVTCQYVAEVPTFIRSNVDLLFVLRDPVLQNREKLYKIFFGIFPTFASFSAVFTQCTEGYECIVLDQCSKSNAVEDAVFYFKAAMRDNFKMCPAAVWNYHRKTYEPHSKHEGGGKATSSSTSYNVTKL
jgi:hypothetical protein